MPSRGIILGSAIAALCASSIAADLAANRPVTFSKDVAPILQQKCQVCHREGSMAPMSLMTYEQTRPWAKAIRQRVITRQMPPWHLDKTVGVQKFKNDISLSDDQIATIVQWVDAGSPQGDPKDMPPPKQWPKDTEWQAGKEFGEPDIIVKADPYTMPAHHQDVWWRPEAKIPLTEPRWVRAVEVRPTTPGARKIVHHAVAYLEQEDADAPSPGATADADRQGVLMEWAIGKSYDAFRPDTGKLLVPGSKISWDVHIHAVGEELTAGVEIGIWLYKKGQEPKYRTHLTAFPGKTGPNLDIPPNSLVESEGFTVLKQAAIFENIQPHMHLRGKAMSLQAILPDGSTQMVSYVGNFNFNWMNNYIYDDEAAPVFPKGTVIKVTSWHDNTKDNPFNPDPDQWVGYGHRTVDEMAHAWVNVTYISDEDYSAWASVHKKKTVAENGR